MEKIISVVFHRESEGYQAMTELKNAPVTNDYIVSQAVLVRKEAGRIIQLDSFDTGMETANDTAKGGIVGGIVGILGGPIGILLGGSLGALVGSAVDTGDAVHNASVFERMTEQFVDGEVALIAFEQEAVEGAAQKMLAKFDVTIVEEDAAEVEEEVQHAIEVQKELEKETKKRLRAEKKEERQKKVSDRREKIKEHFENLKKKKD